MHPGSVYLLVKSGKKIPRSIRSLLHFKITKAISLEVNQKDHKKLEP